MIQRTRFFMGFLAMFAGIFLVIPSTSLEASINTVYHMRNVDSILTVDTLIVIDLDLTIMHPTHPMMATPMGRKYTVEQLTKKGISSDKIAQLTTQAESQVRWELVENETKDVIRKWQNAGYVVVGLTHRGKKILGWPYSPSSDKPDIYEFTKKQLSTLGIDFSKTAPKSTSVTDICNRLGGKYASGIIFTEGKPAGRFLTQILSSLPRFRQAVVIEDQLNTLSSVEKDFMDKQTQFRGFIYAGWESAKKPFNPSVASRQIDALLKKGIIPSDDEVLKQIQAEEGLR